MTEATESIVQRFLQALGTLRRKESQVARLVNKPNRLYTISTGDRQAASVGAADLRGSKFLFHTAQTPGTLSDEQLEFWAQITEPGSNLRNIRVENIHDWRTPVNAVIADSRPERDFIMQLLKPENLPHYTAWLKSTTVGFYEIEYH